MQRILSAVILVLSIFVLFAEAEKVKKIKYKGEKWIKVDAVELYHQIDEYVYKNIYFEINYVYASNYRSILGKKYLSFYVGTGKKHGYIWVKGKQKDILKVLYNCNRSGDKLGIFAQVTRKKDYQEYEHFVITKHIIELEDRN